jgi:hypothetical protein
MNAQLAELAQRDLLTGWSAGDRIESALKLHAPGLPRAEQHDQQERHIGKGLGEQVESDEGVGIRPVQIVEDDELRCDSRRGNEELHEAVRCGEARLRRVHAGKRMR